MAQFGYAVAHGVAIAMLFIETLQLPYGFAYAPQLGIVGVALKTALVAIRQHLVVHSRGIAHSQHRHAAVHEFLAYPVDCHIRLSAHQHLRFAIKGLVDGFHERGGLACAGRPMHYHHIAACHYIVNSHFLAAIEPRKAHGIDVAKTGLYESAQHIAQCHKASVAGLLHIVKGFEHSAIAGFVERELHTQAHRIFHIHYHRCARHHYSHAIIFHIAHSARVVLIGHLPHFVFHKKAHLSAIFKLVFLFAMLFAAIHFHHQLIERIIMISAHTHRVPTQSALHITSHAEFFTQALIFFLLVVVFHLQQLPLPQKMPRHRRPYIFIALLFRHLFPKHFLFAQS